MEQYPSQLLRTAFANHACKVMKELHKTTCVYIGLLREIDKMA